MMSDSADDQQSRATQRAMRRMRKWTPEQWEAQRRAIKEGLEKERGEDPAPASSPGVKRSKGLRK